MMNGYSTHLSETFGQLPLGWISSVFPRCTDAPQVSADPASREMQVQRLLCLMVVVLLLAFAAVYQMTDTSSGTSLWPEAALAAVAMLGLGLSYANDFLQRHFHVFVRVLCYVAAFWFIILAAINGFDTNYAVGLLFIIPGIGVGYSISLRKVWPLAIYFFAAVSVAAAASYLVPHLAIAPAVFLGSLVCISLVTVLIAAARLQAENRFIASEERYRAVVEQASDGIYLIDAATLRFLDANPAYLKMVGYSVDELRSKTIYDLIILDRNSFRTGAPVSGNHAHISERRLRRKDGTVIHVELHVDRIMYAGRDVMSVVAHDISQRKEYETSLISAKENAEQIAGFKSVLLTNMSHEVRTPLSSILGWSAVLRDEVTESQREIVDLIEQSGRRLHNTLDSVLELAHLHANSKGIHPVILNLSEEVQGVFSQMQTRAEEKGLELHVEVPQSNCWVEMDASCLRRILTHLVDNAVKFTDHGEIRVTLETTESDARITVRDTGVGIAPAFLPHVFEEFKQESEGLSRDHEGNGLGLAIVRRLTQLAGGRVLVESEKGVGSSFTVDIPGAVFSGKLVDIPASPVARVA